MTADKIHATPLRNWLTSIKKHKHYSQKGLPVNGRAACLRRPMYQLPLTVFEGDCRCAFIEIGYAPGLSPYPSAPFMK